MIMAWLIVLVGKADNLQVNLRFSLVAYSKGIYVKWIVLKIRMIFLRCEKMDLGNNLFKLVVAYLLVLKGEAGSPSLLYRFAPSGLSAQAYLTATGLSTSSFHTTT